MLNPPKRRMLGLMLGFAALDQLSKWLTVIALRPEESVPLIPGVFQLTLAYNTGAAFSLLRHQPQLLTVLTSLIFLVLLGYGLSRRQWMKHEVSALALILGGALGNLIDRFQAGRVTDFLDVVAVRYPVFNLADSLIFCGVALLVLAHLRQARATESPEEARSGAIVDKPSARHG
jgi:signal peptidase II